MRNIYIEDPDLSVNRFRSPYQKIAVSLTHEINNDKKFPDQEWFYIEWFKERELGLTSVKDIKEVHINNQRFVQIQGDFDEIIKEVNDKINEKN